MSDITNAEFAAYLAERIVEAGYSETSESALAAEIEGKLDQWYTLTTTAANRLASIMGAIDGIIITDGVPGSGVGEDNAYAFDAANGGFYGPKTNGAWGSANFSLVGPPGTAATITVGTVTTGAPGSSASVTNSGTANAAVFDIVIPTGNDGDDGDAATITVGDVTTGDAGSSASVTNSGTQNAAVLDFTIPRGDEGEAATITVGDVTTGAAGSSAAVTNSGTTSAAVFDFTIPKGDDGEAATVSVGTVTTLAAGESATVTNSGTSAAAVFDFAIPAGADGDDGDAATVSVGTVTTGDPGTPAAVSNSGTTSAAVLDFTIPEGDPGEAATITIGTVTTLAPGESATVTNSGTSGAAVFDFEIPQGPQGTVGDSLRGAWDSGMAYVANDVVTYQGETWLALQGSTNSPPAEGADWTKLAAKGADGTGSGTVTSVAATGSNGIVITGSPITESGTLAFSVNAGALRTHLNVADGATANASDAALRDRSTHTGTQAIDTIAGLQDALDNAGGGLTVAAIQTSAFTPNAGEITPVDTSAGGVALTALPGSPTYGVRFALEAHDESWSPSNPVTLPALEGAPLNGESVDLIFDEPGIVFGRWAGENFGWEIVFVPAAAIEDYRRISVAPPSVTSPSEGATDQPENLTVTSSAFAMLYGSDSHAASDWQIASDSGFSTIVAESLDDAANKVSWTLPFGELSTSTTYYARVRHSGAAAGDSEWSDGVSFTTAAEFTAPEALAVVNAMTTPPDGARQALIIAAVEGLIDAGLWTDIKALWVLAAHTAQAGYLNWKDPTGTALTPVNSPSFIADQGGGGDGSTSYFDTGLAPTSLSGVAQNDVSIGSLVHTRATGFNDEYLGANSLFLRHWSSGGGWRATLNDNALLTAPAEEVNGDLIVANRSAAGAREFYLNGSLVASDTTASSVALPSIPLFLLAQNSGGSPSSHSNGRIAVAFIGVSLNATKQAALESVLRTYMNGL